MIFDFMKTSYAGSGKKFIREKGKLNVNSFLKGQKKIFFNDRICQKVSGRIYKKVYLFVYFKNY